MAEPPYGHESSAIAVRRLLAISAILGVAVLLTVIVVCIALRYRLEPKRSQVTARIGTIPPPPRLQAHPDADLEALRRQKEAQLESWGWTDRSRQFAHIPIQHALAIYLLKQPDREARNSPAPPQESAR